MAHVLRGVASGNLTRGTFDSSTNKASYLKVHIRPTASPAISWTDVSFQPGLEAR